LNKKMFLHRRNGPALCIVLLCLIGVMLIGDPPASNAQEDLPAIIRRVEPSIVVILTYNQQGKMTGQGTGFFVSKEGDVITNHHVLQNAARAEVRTHDGKSYAVKMILGDDKVGDLVRMSLDIPEGVARALPVSLSFPRVGERIFIIGTPLGLEKTVSDGIVSALREIPGFGTIIQVTAPISPGSSGSPVVNMKGEVIGVATFFVMAGQNLNFAIPGERIAGLGSGEGKLLAEWESVAKDEKLALGEELYQRGLRHLWAADYENALLFFIESLKNSPELASAYFQIGYCLANLGRYDQAIEAYKRALQITPDDADVYNNMCVSYSMMGRLDEAIESCKRAVRIKPDLAEAYSNLGWAHQRLGKYAEGIEFCKQAIRLKPDHALAHYNLGNNYAGLARFTEALESYKQAIRNNPGHAEAHLNLGAAYNQLGRYEEAIESYKQALRIKPRFPEAHLNLGMTYLKLGDRSSALDEYKVLKEQDGVLANRLFGLIYE
jgi:tetratricopeptide (TPR) repeat protein